MDSDLVELLTVSPTILLDLRYATSNNLLGRPLYPVARCFLQRAVAEKLDRVQRSLRKKRFGLKVFDGYRPFSVQRKFWEFLPEPRYCADPAVGSKHNRGAAIDLTLVDEKGRELPMPSDFDEMSEKSHRSYQDGSPQALFHRGILENAMKEEGFLPYPSEWWHFDDPDWAQYPLLDIPLEQL
jgi:D-alanyl-D-alanine dipeptidase